MQSHGSGKYYIGTMYIDCGNSDCKECEEYAFGRPRTKGKELDYNSRETDYFNTKQEADNALKGFMATGCMLKERT